MPSRADWTSFSAPPVQGELRKRRKKHQPTFVLDFKKPLLPEAAERGDAGAGADEDAGNLRVLGQVEPGCAAHMEGVSLTQEA